MTALALLCAAAIASSDCNRSNAVRYWEGDPCSLPMQCAQFAVERAARTGVVARNGEHWVFTSERKEERK